MSVGQAEFAGVTEYGLADTQVHLTDAVQISACVSVPARSTVNVHRIIQERKARSRQGHGDCRRLTEEDRVTGFSHQVMLYSEGDGAVGILRNIQDRGGYPTPPIARRPAERNGLVNKWPGG